MIKLKKITFLFLLFTFVFTSCEEDDPKPQEDTITERANVEGSVNLFDQFGNIEAKDRMTVIMDGGSPFVYFSETEKDGAFIVPNVNYHPNYTIIYEKTDYGTYKSFHFNHEYTGGTGQITAVPNLSRLSSTYSTSLSIEVRSDTVFFDLGAHLAKGRSNTRLIRFLFHTIAEISHETFALYTNKIGIYHPKEMYTFTKEQLEEIGLVSGTKYWVQAYGDSYYSNNYTDVDGVHLPNLGLPSEGSVPTDSFYMP